MMAQSPFPFPKELSSLPTPTAAFRVFLALFLLYVDCFSYVSCSDQCLPHAAFLEHVWPQSDYSSLRRALFCHTNNPEQQQTESWKILLRPPCTSSQHSSLPCFSSFLTCSAAVPLSLKWGTLVSFCLSLCLLFMSELKQDVWWLWSYWWSWFNCLLVSLTHVLKAYLP